MTPPKGCVAWKRPQSMSFHRGPHYLGPSCREPLTRAGVIGLAILRDRSMRIVSDGPQSDCIIAATAPENAIHS